MGVTNQQIWDKLGEVETGVALTTQTTQRLVKLIEGNGKPGLCDRVTVIENQHFNEAKRQESDQKQKDKVEEKNKRWFDKGWAVIMLFLAQGVIWLFLVIRGS
jgi:transcriptional regulator with AAA-type ATPase domain